VYFSSPTLLSQVVDIPVTLGHPGRGSAQVFG
jgi:hypothetical protein